MFPIPFFRSERELVSILRRCFLRPKTKPVPLSTKESSYFPILNHEDHFDYKNHPPTILTSAHSLVFRMIISDHSLNVIGWEITKIDSPCCFISDLLAVHPHFWSLENPRETHLVARNISVRSRLSISIAQLTWLKLATYRCHIKT